MREQAKYSDLDRAAALTALEVNGGNTQKTAEQQGIPMQTLHEWAKGRVHPDVTAMKEGMVTALADRCEQLAQSCLNLLTPEKLGEASASQLATILGISVDKMQVLRNKPDHIVTTANLPPDQVLSRLQEIAAEAKQKRLEAESEARETGLD